MRTAADLALVGGLDRLTLESVAKWLAVPTGLIKHCFSATGGLVDEASVVFSAAAGGEAAGQEEENFDRRVVLVREGSDPENFQFATRTSHPPGFTAIDGFAAYVNSRIPFVDAGCEGFISDIAEWSLGLASGALRRK